MKGSRQRRDGEPAARREALRLVNERLAEAYGTPRPGTRRPPIDEVVFTILSQNTTDVNRDRAWADLRARFDDWDAVAGAPLRDIAAAIRAGGLHRTKARRIKELLRQVRRERGELALDHLEGLDAEGARQELARFKGLGAKSINCILLFSLGRPAFPVDTHVHRVFRRLGVLETNDLSRANRQAQQLVPDDLAYPLHMNVIRHGREVCSARRPSCWKCCIEDLCAFEDKNLGAP